MQFLAPMMLAGAAAVSVPIALHFFYRARYKPLPWAPMRFLKEAVEQTSRRLKFQEWVLLALRCLALILLALALARPASDALKLTGRGGAIDAVFVIDTSYSMGARDGDKTRIERAREAAAAVLDTLPKGSSVQVYTCADRAALLGPTQKFNLDQARQLVAGVRTTGLSSDLLPGLTEALAAAKAGLAPAKEVYVFTDLQRDTLERQQGAVKAKCAEIKEVANLVFVRCGNPDREVPNVAVADVSWRTEIPHAGAGVAFVVTLKNTGAVPVKGAKVVLELDGKAVGKDKNAIQVDQIDPGQVATVTLVGTLDRAGPGVVAVRVEGDGLPGDNVLYKTILVRDKVRVLLVDGAPKPESPTEAGDWYVRTGFRGPLEGFIETRSVSAAGAGARDLDGKDIVYLLNAPVRTRAAPAAGMSDEFRDALARFVRAGGGLVVAGGDLVDPAAYNQAFGSGGSGLLPFDLKGTIAPTDVEKAPFRPSKDTVDEASFLGPYRKGPFAAALERVVVTRMFDATGPGTGRVLVRTSAGHPYVASKVVGAGEVVLFAGSLDERWGDFSSDPGSFHGPLAVFTATHLTGRRVPGGTATAGAPLVWPAPADAGAAFELVAPAPPGEKVRPRSGLEPGPEADGRRPVTAADTAHAGVYHIVPAGKADDSGPAFAVNPDPREGENLAAAKDADVAEWLGFAPAIVSAGAGTEAAVTDLRTRSEWTEWVLLALLAMLAAEAAWAWHCGRAR